MSKRAKLITTMCSLVIALCAFAFGVFAATKITYDMANSVTYHIKDALVKVTRTVEYLTPTELSIPSTKDTVQTDTTNKTWTQASTITFQTYDDTTGVWKDPQVSGDVTYTNNTISDKINANFNNGYVYKVTVKISSVASTGVKVTYTIPEATRNNAYITAGECTLTSGQTVTTERYLTYYMGVLDLTTSIGTDIAFENISLSIENADVAENINSSSGRVQLYENTESGYYYMYMGEYNDTPVEWRLLSTDGGATRYEYVAGQADSITGDCVFVQNTYTKAMNFTLSSSYKQATADDATNYPGIVADNYYVLDENGAFIALSETTGEDGVTTKEYALANNYEYSAIREYVTGDMVSDLGLTDDETYAKISANADVHNDKFYLLSKDEAITFLNDTDRKFYNGTSATSFWLRSPDSSVTVLAHFVNVIGYTGSNNVLNTNGVRAAFKIAL